MPSVRNFGHARGVGPEGPDRRLWVARLGTTAAAIANALAQRVTQAARAHDQMHHRAAQHAHAQRDQGFGHGKFQPQHTRGQREHGRVHQRRGQPERHDRRQRHAHGQKGRDQRDHPAGAKGRQPARQRAHRDHHGWRAGKRLGDQVIRAGCPRPCCDQDGCGQKRADRQQRRHDLVEGRRKLAGV